MIPIVPMHDMNAKNATVRLVSYLPVTSKQIIEAKISAIAVDNDIR